MASSLALPSLTPTRYSNRASEKACRENSTHRETMQRSYGLPCIPRLPKPQSVKAAIPKIQSSILRKNDRPILTAYHHIAMPCPAPTLEATTWLHVQSHSAFDNVRRPRR